MTSNFSTVVIVIILSFTKVPQIVSYCKDASGKTGCEKYIPRSGIAGSYCGRDAICRWNIKYYVNKQLNGVPPPGIGIPTDLKELDETIIDSMSFVTHPKVPFPIGKCRVRETECIKWLDMLLEAECKRLFKELPKQGPPVLYGTASTAYLKNSTIYDRGFLMGVFNIYNIPKFDGLNYNPVTCPTLRRGWTLIKLYTKNNIDYEEDMMLIELSKFLKEQVRHDMWCELVRNYVIHFYLPYTNEEWCISLVGREFLLCINYNDPPKLPTLQEVLDQCGILLSDIGVLAEPDQTYHTFVPDL